MLIVLLQFDQGVGQGPAGADDPGAGRIGLIFPAAGDGHLDQHGGNRGDDRHENDRNDISPSPPFFVITASTHAQEGAPLGHGG